jgi:hypothetical protein
MNKADELKELVEDASGVRRVWLEPDSSTPGAYDGFDPAAKALQPNPQARGDKT